MSHAPQVLSVDEIRRKRREEQQAEQGKRDAEDQRYNRIKQNIYVQLKTSIDELNTIFGKEIITFLKVQDKVRKKLGCSKRPPSESIKKAFADLIQERDDAASDAQKFCEKAAKDIKSNAEKATAKLNSLASTILQEVSGTYKKKMATVRLEYYPNLMDDKDEEMSPEEAFEIFSAIQQGITLFEGQTKKQWLDGEHGIDELDKILGELAFIIQDYLKNNPDAMKKVIKNATDAFDQLVKVNKTWSEGTLSKDYEASKALLQKHVFEVAELKIEAEILEKKHEESRGLQAIKGKKAKQTPEEAADREAVMKKMDAKIGPMYEASKTFQKVSAKQWKYCKSYIPEIFHDLYPSLIANMELMLQSFDAGEGTHGKLVTLFVDRTLEQYESLKYVAPDMISAKYNGKPVILRKFKLHNRSELKCLVKELLMQHKLDPYVVDWAQCIFGDNNFAFFQYDDCDNDLLHWIEREDFKTCASNIIFLIRNMCHVVKNVHGSKIIHGDINENSWIVTQQGLPRLSGFDLARIGHEEEMRTVRESIYADYASGPSDAPEIQKDKDTFGRSYKSDVFGLGKCIQTIQQSGKSFLEVVDLDSDVSKLVNECTHSDPSKRPTIDDVFRTAETLMFKLKKEFKDIQEQKESIRVMGENIIQARADLDQAARLAENDLSEVAARVAAVQKKEESMKQKQMRLYEDAFAIQKRERFEDTLKPPSYWKASVNDRMWELHPVEKNSTLFQVFRHVITTDDPNSLNKGRDVVERGNYSFLDLVGVWRLENSLLWRNFAVERRNLKESLGRRGIKCPEFEARPNLEKAISHFPGGSAIQKEVNETYLLHGTGPDVVLSIASNGINERFTNVALFGKGSYFAEDAGKTDQYVRGDGVLGQHPELHRRLFPNGGEYNFPEYPYKAYYLFLCRVIMGYMVRVRCTNTKKKEMFNIDNEGGPIFATADQRELAAIPGIENPPILYHSLVAEKGAAIVRFREMVQFHSARVYPEYLICFTRK